MSLPGLTILEQYHVLCVYKQEYTAFWSSITFYVSTSTNILHFGAVSRFMCLQAHAHAHARPLFTWRNLWHVPTIYLFARLMVPVVKTWLDHEEVL